MSYIKFEGKKYVPSPEIEWNECTGCALIDSLNENICPINNDKNRVFDCGLTNIIYKEHFVEILKKL